MAASPDSEHMELGMTVLVMTIFTLKPILCISHTFDRLDQYVEFAHNYYYVQLSVFLAYYTYSIASPQRIQGNHPHHALHTVV